MVKRKYITDFIIDSSDVDKILEERFVLPEKEKNKILDYLTRFDVVAATTATVTDKFTGTDINKFNNCRSDGTYYWVESEIYHFKRYDIKHKPDFVVHVLRGE